MRVLVVGGTGGFGSTICSLLADDGHDVTAASRSVPANMPKRLKHVQLDRERVTPKDLAGFDLVVDAAGPFQEQDASLLDVAIAAGVHHVDISDDDAFVADATSRDAAASAAGVVVVSGASSVPGLSSAVALEQSAGMTEVERVDVAISASAKAVFGRSVLAAMLSGAGIPLPWRGFRTIRAMTSPRWVSISSPKGDLRRQVLACSAPDARLLPEALPGNPAVRFRAGSEFVPHNLSMRAIALAVISGLVRSGTAFAGMAGAARRLTSGFGSGRSGMLVETIGRIGGQRVLRRWSLVAENGSGPTIPCLVVPAIVDAIARGSLPPGAHACLGLVDARTILSRFPSEDYDVTIEERAAPGLYERATGSAWQRFDPVIRSMHDQVTDGVAIGRTDVTRGDSPVARILCSVFGFPDTGRDVPVRVGFEVEDGRETWTRSFAGRRFVSRLSHREGGVEERFGPLRFRFTLEERAGALRMVPDGWSLWHLPLPRFLAPTGIAVEDRSEDGLFRFDVPIEAPLVGRIVHYRGTLGDPVPPS